MAYTPTNWVSGETPLSAENMNNIEQGIVDLNSKTEINLGNGIYAIKNGNIVFVTFETCAGMTVNANSTFAQLPEGYRPYSTVSFLDSIGSRRVVVGQNGAIRCTVALQSGGNPLRGGVTFVSS